MAAAVSAASAAGASSSLAKDMELVHNSIMGHLELSPAHVSHFVHVECKDKLYGETYRDYCERVHGSPLSDEQWKKWSNFSYEKFQTDDDPNKMDITALGHLFHTLFRAKRDSRDRRQFMKQLQNLKDLRNNVMHNRLAARDPGALGELEAALQAFIKEAGTFYSLPSTEVQDLLLKLKQDVKAGFSPGKKKQLYACSCTIQEGWITMEQFHQYHFTTQNLLFEIGHVRRSDVFYSPEVLMGGDEKRNPVPFWEIFEQGEKITIVFGEAGSGKSTLLENIALQFINRQPCSPGLLQDFQLMVYVQCRDQSCKSLKDVIQQQFFDVCTKLGVDDVLDAVLKLRTLFIIDSFGETQKTMTVVQEVIREVWRANCKVIISTRPRAAKQLRNMLSDSNVCFLEFEMAPLGTLEKQLDFLSKYEPHLPRIQSKGALLECFKSIPEPIRSLFSEPIKLLQFCSVFEKMPDRIKNWETISDVTEDIFLIYKTLVDKKLSGVRYPNIDIVIDDIFQVICKAAFDFTRSNIFTLTEAQFANVQRSCLSKIREDHDIKDLEVGVVLTSVMKMTRSFMRRGKVIYSFNHRSDQEYFASRHVVHLLETSTDSLRRILQGGTQKSQASAEDEEEHLTAILPSYEELFEGKRCSASERPPPTRIDVLAAAVADAIPGLAKITEERTKPRSPSEEAEVQRMMQKVPSQMAILTRKLAPMYMKAVGVDLKSDLAGRINEEIEAYLPSFIESNVSKISDILSSFSPFVEVLQYVIRDISARNPSLLQQRWPEIKEALEEMGAGFGAWRDMVLNSPRDTWLVRSAAQAAVEKNTAWKMSSGRDISAAALMLRHAQPRLLEVRLMPSDTVNQDRWTQVIQRRDGDLELELLGFRCCDDFLKPLLNGRCRLVRFHGKVTTSSSLEALASVACDDAVLHVSVPAPLNFCSLENKCKELWVNSPSLDTDVRGEGASVLPSLPRPRLIIDEIPSGSWMKVVQTITTFTPFSNRYESLLLQDCKLMDSELDQLVVALQGRGIRTAGDGRSGWVKRLWCVLSASDRGIVV